MNLKKNINTKVIWAALSGLLIFNACVDKNDWGTDDDYDRLFRPSKLEILSISATEATVSFVAIPGTDYYHFELSKDSLEFTNIVAQFDTLTNKLLLENLDGNTKYSVRIKALPLDASKAESKWAEIYFKTRAEQIMQTVNSGDILSRSVVLHWTPGATVTNLVILDANNTQVQNITISAESVASGTIQVTGLSPESSYTALLMNGTAQRGSASFTTFPDVPEAELIIRLAAGDLLTQETFDTLTVSSVTFTFPAGQVFDMATGGTNLKSGVAYNFFGLPGEEKATLSVNRFNLGATHEYVKFNNLNLSGISGTSTYGYLINQADATTIGTIEFANCSMHDFSTTLFRLQGTSSKLISNLVVTNCIAYNQTQGYALFHGNSGTIDNILINNSTFYNVERFLLHDKTNNSSLVISDCTFNNIIINSRYLIDYGSSLAPNTFEIRNSIFGATKDPSTARGIRAAKSPSVSNSYGTSDMIWAASPINGLNTYSGTSTDLFADPANGNFSIKDESFEGKVSAGDPRWYFN